MSTSHSQESRTDQSGKRRKRKDRSVSRAPEPKNIVSGAGQPLDVSVRRELEEQLGHDFGRVRLHTDRDAGALTEMLGADAVAVGQDIFFREGAYRPGTADGQRLLAHELLHTVQNPHGLGALRAGRDLGAVSLPQQATEREAESAAQESVREGEPGTPVEEGHATPGWLRYATVDADRNRLEQIDPATLVDRLANSVVRSLRGDPEDRSKRTRMQLARLPDELQDAVLDRLETRLLSSEHERVLDLVDEIEIDEETDQQLEQSSLDAPAVESDLFEEVAFERDRERQSAEERQEETDRPPVAPGPEKEWSGTDGAPGSTPQNGGTPQDGTTPQGGEAPRGGEQAQEPGGAGEGGGPAAEQQPSAGAPSSQQAAPEQGAAAGGKSEGGPQGGEKKSAGAVEKEAPEQQEAPAASEEESAARNRPGAVDALVAGQQVKPEARRGEEKPTGSPTVSGKGTQDPGPFSRLDGVRNQDLDPEEKAEEDPFGSGSESEVEVGGGEKSAWDIKLQPEDFLPEQDLDVSGVPTADELDPSSSTAPAAPSFPAPPVTKADKVQAERDAEDAEDQAAEAEEESDGADALGDTEPSAQQEESTAGAGESGGLALGQAASAPPAPGSMTKDPKSGADPKAGPVAAQTAVQEAPGKSEGGSDSKEAAAKEEKGTPAAGDKAGAGQEKASPQAAGGKASAPDSPAREEQKKTDTGPAGRSEPTADSQGSSPARDSHVSGGSNADKPGVATGDAASGTQSGSSGGDQPTPSESRAETPAPTAPAPVAPEPVKAPEAPAAAPAPKSGPAAKRESAPKPAPAAKAPRGGGGGGGGKASVPAKGRKDSAPAPNLSGVAPEAGLATASKLKPHTALQAMGGVSGSVDRTVGDEHKALAAAPPSMQRPAGAPQTLEGKPKADAPAQYSQDPAQKSEAPKDEKAEVTGAKEPEGQIEAEKAEEPGGWDTFKMALGFGIGKVLSWVGFEVDAQELAAKFAGLPTKDEALKQAQAGNAPGVEMQGAAEQTAGEQGSAVDAKGQEAVTTARDDSGRAMGENQVYPHAPKEQMRAKVPGGQGGKGGGAPAGGSPTGAVPPEAASEVAEHERGPQFQAAFSDGQKGMSEGRQTKDRDFRDSQQKHKQKVDAEIATNTESQAGEREKAMSDVTAQRADWRTEQDAELKKLGTKKTERHEKVRKDVKDKEEKTDEDVTKEKEDGDKKIQDENTKAERDAEKKRDDSVNESGNWVTKAFDWIKQKVIEIKNAIVRVIRAARDAVIGFIKNFKETVERWINEARKFIVDTIKNLINDLIEFAKAMVRAVIELANRIRKFITDLIAAAIALVNKLANMLKQIISDLLDAIGKLLSSILDILKKMLQDVIKAVVDAIKSVLDFAAKLLSALGDFMLIAVDFLSDPGGWLGGAKNSAVDGAKNHLFREVQAAVKSWFQSKIEEIIGVPKAILDKLIKGGITLEQIVKETWDAIVPQLPLIIGEIVITKVIAKLIPGAGWVMAVIDAIRVAIGALGEILRAMGAVLTWLKAVRQGGAGVLFAKAVAAGIVALLELAYEALLSGIGKYVAKVGRRLKGVAANLGKDKGGDKDKAPGGAGAPADDKKGGPAPTPSKPTTTPGPRPTTPRPGPGTRPGPGRPTTPGPSGKPKTGPGDGKKPTGPDKDAPGRPKDKDQEKSPTRPTPAPKPKPKPPAKTETETDPKSRPPKDDTPAKPKDDKDAPGKPKDQDPNRPKDQDPNRPKDKDDKKDGPAKPKDGKDGKDGKKPDKPKDGDGRKPKDKDRDKGPDKPRKDKGKDDKPKDKDPEKKQEAKDRRKKEEDSKESKDERLRKIIARIRPKIGLLLRSSVPPQALDAALAGMRAWHRLTGLSRSSSPAFEVVATLNPSGKAEDGYKLTGADLRPLIREVTDDLLDNPDVAEAAREMRREKHEAENENDRQGINEALKINGGRDIPAVVRYLRDRGKALDVSRPGEPEVIADPYRVGPGKMELYDIGENEDRVKEQKQVWGITNLITQRIGKYQHLPEGDEEALKNPGGRKPEESLKSVGLTGPRFALGLRTYVLEGRAPEGFTPEQAELVRNAHWLMFVRESHRNTTNLGYAAMTTDLLSFGAERGGLTPHDAFAAHEGQRLGDRGWFPMSMLGAARSARGLEEEEVQQQTTGLSGSKAEREELKYREEALAEKWVLAKTKGEGIIGDDKPGALKKGRELIKKFLLQFYGL
ncbi:DUF4157 domain-containing protein [Streptomyces sp. PKU-EA00015]|uniref:eCIS core domain-containing protein n=1 Tax=Streptomyces sp. PKU-EA00015 TaxID=2748326 RepID=UPI00159F8EE8|nr:DUF4157 domain-containing protein [Streptomyces sp. PKU-EA00015]NWF25890.1 DUF4157 domain-containing protein [Streptomyces sp. PKU-EA00015]